MKHIDLARNVMEMLLDGDDEVLSLLKKQYETAEIVSEELGEVGFYINYHVENFAINQEQFNSTFQIGDVDGVVNNINGAVGFILYVKDGFLTMLEGYVNIVDEWPEKDYEIKLVYDTGKSRDYASLKKKWTKVI